MENRRILKQSKGLNTMDGAGVKLVRVFTGAWARDIDPFLMLDVFDSDNYEDYKAGFPFHPHRGIETITYLFEGEMEHQDNLGHREVIGPGDAQWMTSGRGIIHQEMPLNSPKMRGAQLWLNLPKEHKMTEAKYNSILAGDIEVVEEEGKKIRVIAGSYKEAKGFRGSFVDATYLDVSLDKNAQFDLEVPRENNAFIYIFDGSLQIEGEEVAEKNGIVLGEGDHLSLKATEASRFILLFGRPLNEPIAFGGPVVMNTRQEVEEAFRELREGTFIKD